MTVVYKNLGGVQISNDLWGVPLSVTEDNQNITVEYVNYTQTLVMDKKEHVKRALFNKERLSEEELCMIRSCKERYNCRQK